MLTRRNEWVAALLVFLTLVGLPAWIYWMEFTFAGVGATVGVGVQPRVLTLTGVADGGIWTEDEVLGHSYWRRRPKPTEQIVIQVGEMLVIRFKSADVTHGFTIPNLNIGPVQIEPGHVAELWFVPAADPSQGPGWNVQTVSEGRVISTAFVLAQPGQYLTQCSFWCGKCHEEMRGTFIVLGPGQTLADYPTTILPPRNKCPYHAGAGSDA